MRCTFAAVLIFLLTLGSAFAQNFGPGSRPAGPAAGTGGPGPAPPGATPQPGTVIELEVTLAEWPEKDNGPLAADATGKKAAERVAQLDKDGKLTVSKRLRMTTYENVISQMQLGERRARVTGITSTAGGGFPGAAAARRASHSRTSACSFRLNPFSSTSGLSCNSSSNSPRHASATMRR
jgi:hypothetical protein